MIAFPLEAVAHKSIPRHFKMTSYFPCLAHVVHLRIESTVKDQLMATRNDILHSVLRSHAISHDAYNALADDDPVGFITLRANYIAKLEGEFMKYNDINPPREFDDSNVDIDTDDIFQEDP